MTWLSEFLTSRGYERVAGFPVPVAEAAVDQVTVAVHDPVLNP